FVESQNLTMRMAIRRFTRLTNAFSKKLDNLKAACALHFAYYNFCRIHKSLRVTPAMEAGLTDHIWTLRELLSQEFISFADTTTRWQAGVLSFWIVASGNAPKSIAVGVCPVQAKTLQVGEASVAKILADKDVRKLLGTVIFNADEG